MESRNSLLRITGWILIVFIISNCSKKVENPVNKTITLKTLDPTIIDFASAAAGGSITSKGDLPLLEKGICYSISSSPTISDSVIFQITLLIVLIAF